jgi:chemotaxis protein MotB
MKKYISLVVLSLVISSCTTVKKLNTYKNAFNEVNDELVATKLELQKCKTESVNLEKQVKSLNNQISSLETNNTSAIGILEQLTVLTNQQAVSINETLQNIKKKEDYIGNLRSNISFRDSLNMILVYNLKSSLSDINDGDINIKVEKSAIFIDIADKLLFKSGSYTVNDNAKNILLKVSTILEKYPTFEVMVEGNTDNVPFNEVNLIDNFDLSVKRATSVSRILMSQGIDPKRLIASGRGEFKPIDTNETPEGRQSNRRTRIVILPQLDEFFKLLEKN